MVLSPADTLISSFAAVIEIDTNSRKSIYFFVSIDFSKY